MKDAKTVKMPSINIFKTEAAKGRDEGGEKSGFWAKWASGLPEAAFALSSLKIFFDGWSRCPWSHGSLLLVTETEAPA